MTDPSARQRGRPTSTTRNCQTVPNIWSWAPEGARHQDWLTDWPSVVTGLWLWLYTYEILLYNSTITTWLSNFDVISDKFNLDSIYIIFPRKRIVIKFSQYKNSINNNTDLTLYVAVEWSALMLRFREVSDSKLGSETGYLGWGS
jgi:hypothetical protein